MKFPHNNPLTNKYKELYINILRIVQLDDPKDFKIPIKLVFSNIKISKTRNNIHNCKSNNINIIITITFMSCNFNQSNICGYNCLMFFT